MVNVSDLIERIENLTEEQFELLIFYLQLSEEFDPIDLAPPQTSA